MIEISVNSISGGSLNRPHHSYTKLEEGVK